MKKFILSIFISTIISFYSMAQWTAGQLNTAVQTTGGNVGIGTSTPASKLEVGGNNSTLQGADISITRTSTSSEVGRGATLQFNDPGSGSYNIIQGSSTGLQFYNYYNNGGWIERMRIAANGNIGIGTSTTSEKLEVNGSIKITRNSRLEANRGRLCFSNAAGDWNHTIYNNFDNIDGEGGWDGMKFNCYGGMWFRVGAYNNYKTALFASGDGQIGIGTSSPWNDLHIKRGANVESAVILENTSSNKILQISNYGPTGDGLYWAGLSSANTGSLKYTETFVLRSTNGLIFSGSNTAEHMRITPGGKVGIGTSTPDVNYELSVNGKIKTKEMRVTQLGWSDYVFYNNYKLKPLSEVESFIKANQHLPEVPSASEVEKEGINVGEMNALLLKKIEELTLYMIEMKKENEALKGRVQKLESR